MASLSTYHLSLPELQQSIIPRLIVVVIIFCSLIYYTTAVGEGRNR